MSETIFFYTAIYATTLVLIGLLLTMREFSRLSGRELLKAGKDEHAVRLGADTALGYVPGYSGACLYSRTALLSPCGHCRAVRRSI